MLYDTKHNIINKSQFVLATTYTRSQYVSKISWRVVRNRDIKVLVRTTGTSTVL